MKQKLLFIDRDGTLIREPDDEQIDAFDKLEFLPGVFKSLSDIVRLTDYKLVLVSNQDGLGTASFPENTFYPVHNFIISTLKGEGISFIAEHIDRHFPEDNAPTRKPGTAMLTQYMSEAYDLASSYVIGDRETDRRLAENLGCGALIISNTLNWPKIAEILIAGDREALVERATKETDIRCEVFLDRPEICEINTGLGFLDHMLSQLPHHANVGLRLSVKGDLYVDEHHTVEDTALALGECLRKAVGNKIGLQRYGYAVPMDDCLAMCALDFGGRPWLVWEAEFKRERIGDVPTELFHHFFKSLSDAAAINLFLSVSGTNEHHKIEGLFKAFARALRVALARDTQHLVLPSSKGLL